MTCVELGGLAEGSCDPTAPVCVGESLVWVSLRLFPFSTGKATITCAFLTRLIPNAGEILPWLSLRVAETRHRDGDGRTHR